MEFLKPLRQFRDVRGWQISDCALNFLYIHVGSLPHQLGYHQCGQLTLLDRLAHATRIKGSHLRDPLKHVMRNLTHKSHPLDLGGI
jgi:hypothetical protein